MLLVLNTQALIYSWFKMPQMFLAYPRVLLEFHPAFTD